MWTRLARLLVGIGFVAVFGSAPAQAGPIVNGDFELGNVGFNSDYQYSPGNFTAWRTYDIVTDPSLTHASAASYGDHTSGSGFMMAVNGADVANAVVWSQTVAVSPNTDYDFRPGSPAGLPNPRPSWISFLMTSRSVRSQPLPLLGSGSSLPRLGTRALLLHSPSRSSIATRRSSGMPSRWTTFRYKGPSPSLPA